MKHKLKLMKAYEISLLFDFLLKLLLSEKNSFKNLDKVPPLLLKLFND